MKIQVVLGLASSSNAQVLIDGDYYVASMTGNTYFAPAAIVALLTEVKTSLTNLRTAINAPPSNNKADTINKARDVVDRNLTMLGNKVEEVSNDPSIPDASRLEIAHSSGMDTKSQGHPKRRVFTVTNTKVSGTVSLAAQGGANAHEWQSTDDVINFKGRVAAETTTVAHTEIPNLTKGKEYAFFHKSIVAGHDTSWEGPILLVVT